MPKIQRTTSIVPAYTPTPVVARESYSSKERHPLIRASEGKIKPPNARRGRNWREHASRFITDFPVGTRLSAERFDDWAISCGYLEEPSDRESSSAAWIKHVQMRNALRSNINLAGTNPKVMDRTFKIVIDTHRKPTEDLDSIYAVLDPFNAMQRLERLPKQLSGWVKRKLDKGMHLMQSERWKTLSKGKQLYVNSLANRLGRVAEHVELHVRNMIDDCKEYENNLKLLGLDISSDDDDVLEVDDDLLIDESDFMDS